MSRSVSCLSLFRFQTTGRTGGGVVGIAGSPSSQTPFARAVLLPHLAKPTAPSGGHSSYLWLPSQTSIALTFSHPILRAKVCQLIGRAGFTESATTSSRSSPRTYPATNQVPIRPWQREAFVVVVSENFLATIQRHRPRNVTLSLQRLFPQYQRHGRHDSRRACRRPVRRGRHSSRARSRRPNPPTS